MADTTARAAGSAGAPGAGELIRAWAAIGLQSFGGGTATLYLMRREVVERRGWVTDEEFARFWGICQIAPGINLIGQAILIGWTTAGALGVAIALAGLLLPSVAITVLITAAYATVRDQPLVGAVLRGVVPATAGLGLLLAVQMARQPLAAAHKEGRASLSLGAALLLGSALLVGFAGLAPLTVLWGAGLAGALAHWLRARGGRR
ncbi:MAG TPA: chromate transporter [Roseiflexaceae bacterium]|nr:chromate transporter [Roseiflexaceae bacterium]